MKVKIVRTELMPDSSKKVYAEIKTGLFQKEPWVFVKDPGQSKWFPRRTSDDESRYKERTLNPRYTKEFLKIVSGLKFDMPSHP
jgi:hypothetical protein